MPMTGVRTAHRSIYRRRGTYSPGGPFQWFYQPTNDQLAASPGCDGLGKLEKGLE